MSFRSRRFPLAVVAAALLAGAAHAVHAAELGEARVSSHIGQQLVADVELTLLEDAATPVQVRLASPEVYSEAGIAPPPVLSSLSLSVMRRDGRQFLHATTLRPVEADHLHLYLELVDHGQHAVRLVTLWLSADPHPAPALPVVAPVPAAAAAIAAPASAPAPAHAREAAAPPARSGAAPRHAEAAHPARAPLPRALPIAPLRAVHADAQPAACMRDNAAAQACAALGAKNAELRTRIGQLEARVQGLQASLGAGGKGAAPAAPAKPAAQPAPAKSEETAHAEPPKPAAAPARPAGPKPISSIRPLVPHQPKAAPPDDGSLPWAMIGGGVAVLAAAGGVAALVRARRALKGNVDIPQPPGLLERLRARLAARGKAADPAGVVDPLADSATEPTLE